MTSLTRVAVAAGADPELVSRIVRDWLTGQQEVAQVGLEKARRAVKLGGGQWAGGQSQYWECAIGWTKTLIYRAGGGRVMRRPSAKQGGRGNGSPASD